MTSVNIIALGIWIIVFMLVLRDGKKILSDVNVPKTLFIVSVLALIISGVYFFQNILAHLVYSTIAAYIISPIVRIFRGFGLSKIPSILGSYLVIFICLALLLNFIVPEIATQTKTLQPTFENINNTIDQIAKTKDSQDILNLTFFKNNPGITKFVNKHSKWLNDFVFQSTAFQEAISSISKEFQNWMFTLPQKAINLLNSLLSILSYLLMVPIITFFLLKDSGLIQDSIFKLIPNRYFELTILIKERFGNIIGKYLRALFVQVIVISTLASVFLTIAGVKYSLIIGILAGLANMIPYFGPVLGIFFAVFSVLLVGQPMYIIWYAIISMLFVQAIDNIVVYPLIMGKTTNMHPLIIMLAVIAGGISFGILGMFLAVPVLSLATGMVSLIYNNLRDFKII